MPIETFYVTPATVIHPGVTTDRYGNTVDDWTNTTTAAVNGWLHDVTGTEALGGRDTLISTRKFFCPVAAAITGIDRLEIEGQTFRVDGPPHVARTPQGPHHLEVTLRLIDDLTATTSP